MQAACVHHGGGGWTADSQGRAVPSIIRDRHDTILFVKIFNISDFYFIFSSHHIKSIESLNVFLRAASLYVPLAAVCP